MKQFFKYTLATIVGIIIMSILGIFMLVGVIGALSVSESKPTKVKENSIYQLELSGSLVDRSTDDPFTAALADALGQSDAGSIGLDDVLENIEKAKNDSNIVGIYLKGGTLSGGIASLKEIRDALLDFKSKGKFVLAYADVYAQSNYYLASVADKILLNPSGMVDWKGLAAELMFFKNTLDKLGVEMQVVKVGTFKSAVEPYIETKMSEANRLQVKTYVNSIWNTLVDEVAESRAITVEQLNKYADEMMLYQDAQKYITYNLIDSLVYADEVDSILKDMSAEKYEIVKHKTLCKLPSSKKYKKEKVAVIYAVGGIDGNTPSDGINSTKLVETIDKVAKDDKVKAIVLRVSSPGGSAYGSEQIWRALSKLKEKKPLVVSMGDYAASGGYYIACMADTIVAQPNTITGSIGIFGLIPNIAGLNKKLGLTYDGVKTNKLSDAVSANRPFTSEERMLMQTHVDAGYELFVKRCADGRSMTTDEIKAIAEGRVWTGKDAMDIGLVDVLGSLNDAVVLAAERAELDEYQVRTYPEKEDFAGKLMKSLMDDAESRFIKSYFGEYSKAVEHLRKVENMQGVQARMPYEVVFR